MDVRSPLRIKWIIAEQILPIQIIINKYNGIMELGIKVKERID